MKNKSSKIETLRDFPSVEILSGDKSLAPYRNQLTRPLVVQVVKEVIENEKEAFRSGGVSLTRQGLVKTVQRELERLCNYDLRPVINGAGIIIHTNLGRAPLSREMLDGAFEILTGYSNLEFDLAGGRRGQRGLLVEKLLAVLCQTEAGTIVNNNAGALFIILNTLANKKEVVISRGELVQIGGGFRIPDIMIRSGVRLIEVGTTNHTVLGDYEAGIGDRTRMILKVHRSNFSQEGFVEEVSVGDLSELCRKRGLILVHDLGSGLIAFPPQVKIPDEPSVSDSVRAGADLTCFSGDKLLGGAQAGLIAGRADLIGRIKKNPLFRTLRCDKIVFSIAAQVLVSHIRGTQFDDIPVWRMINIPASELKRRGKKITSGCRGKRVSLVPTRAYLGGGSTPARSIPSLALSVSSDVRPNTLAARFRRYSPPIIGRVEKDEFLIDLRTILPETDRLIIEAINKLV